MNPATVVTEEERDVVKELTNIGMGRAAALLADILERRVLLEVPKVEIVTRAGLKERLHQRDSISLTGHGFAGGFLAGEAWVAFSGPAYQRLATTYGYRSEQAAESATQRELLLEMGTHLVVASLSGVAEQFATEVDFAAPRLYCVERWTSVYAEVFAERNLNWETTILLEIGFEIADDEFKARLYGMLAPASLPELKTRIAALLETL